MNTQHSYSHLVLNQNSYDKVFITHLPAFYKVNLYNEIAKKIKIFVIFIAAGSAIRPADFTQGAIEFDHVILSNKTFETRKKLKNCYLLFKVWCSLKYGRIVLGGWDLPEYWLMAFLSRKKFNALACESSIYESSTQNWKVWIKKLFLSRIHAVYCSGTPHQQLLKKLRFKGQMKMTKGVGVFRYQPRLMKNTPFTGKFLYVGRLAPEKNLTLLMDAFKQLPRYTLTMVGQGPLEAQLKNRASSNIRFVPYVANAALASWYQEHDVFILPSLKEPWGLVVEEAIYYGLPVLISTHVGCAKEIVEDWQAGFSFDPKNAGSLLEVIERVQAEYDRVCKNIKNISFSNRDKWQIAQYTGLNDEYFNCA